MTGYLTKTKDNEDLKSPLALTVFYMDNFTCSEYYLDYQTCMDEYNQKGFFSFGKDKHHKKCMNYLDSYKACIIGINQNMMGTRRELTEEDLHERRKQAKVQTANSSSPPEQVQERVKL